MLAVFACTPNQLQQNQEYDDVYFTASDRAKKPTIVQNPEEVISSNQKALVTSDFSTERVDANLVSKYNNGVENEVVYFEEARVTRPSELNYDDFVYDYENNHLAYYELPLDWQSDWNASTFNQLVNFDFQFQLAWYDQYYLGSSARMNNYLTNSSRRLSRSFNSFGPRVGFDIGFSSFGFGPSPFFAVGMRSVNLNPYGFYDPFFDPFWGYNSYGGGFYNSYYTSISFGRPWGWNRWNNYGGWNRYGGYNNYYASNVIYINNSDNNNANRRTVSRGGRISSTSVSSVRADAINGSSPSTRSGRLASTSPNTRSSRISSSSLNDVSRGSRASSTAVTPTRSSRVSTNAYQFSGSPSSTRSSSVRNNTVRNTRTIGRSSALNTSSARSSSNLFTRSSSSRTATPSYSRSSTGSRTNSFNNARSSSSRSSSFSNNRSSSSSSRSSGSVGSSSSRSSSSSSSRSSSSSSSRSSSSSSSSSRSGRGN
jgi:hypothetical protein